MRLRGARLSVSIWLGAAGIVACGGNTNTPTDPTPPSPITTISAPPNNLTAAPEQRTSLGSLYDVRWTAPAGSMVASYVVEVGSSPGASDVLVADTPGNTPAYALLTNHRGQIVIRARARNTAGLSPPSNEVAAADQRDVIEALFFSTGQLTPSHQPICQFTQLFPDMVEGFPRGTTLEVLISTSLSESHQRAAGRLLDDMTAATGGALQTIRTPSEDRGYMEAAFRTNQFRRTNQLVILDVDDGQIFCGALGCGGGRLAPGASGPLFRNAFVVVQRNAPSGVLAHELAHAVGLCHVPATIAGVPALMGNVSIDQLSAAELAAVRSLFGAGLGPGGTRHDLIAAGLISP